MKSTISKTGLVALLCAITAGSSFAIQIGTTWIEDGNAGRTVATAQDTGSGSLTTISGSFQPASADVDFYNIYLLGGSFSASTSSSTDPMLFLWDSAGNPLLFNDDYFGLQSYIFGSFAAGQYILGISRYSNGYGFHHANTGFGGFEGITPESGYAIHLTGAAASSVPDAGSTLALTGLAMLGLAAVRRKLSFV